MTKKEVVNLAIQGKPVPYVPWNCAFTSEIAQKLIEHYKTKDLDDIINNHFLIVNHTDHFFENIGDERYKDIFGVIWNRTVDKDIGVIEECQLKDPVLDNFSFPDPLDSRHYCYIQNKLDKHKDRFSIFCIGFSLYERAWTLRGMENLMMDFYANPDFVKDLLRSIADYNIAMIRESLKYDIDCIYFGDDWGQQTGLQMGPAIWREFVKPELARMYAEVRDAGKYVLIHSCGKVDEIFDDLIEIGLNCFNPFQPEVMDVFGLMKKYRGKLSFHGGLSTQKTLPYGTIKDVQNETIKLLDAGRNGGYIFAPAHAVESDVPVENILEFLKILHNQEFFVEKGKF